MEDIKGRALVRSAPGAGTTVTLSWAPRQVTAVGQRWHWEDDTLAGLVDLALLLCTPLVAMGLVTSVVLWDEWTHPVLAVTMMVAGIASVFALVRRGRSDGLSWRGSLAISLIAILVVAGATFWIPPGVASALANPAIGIAGLAPVVLVVFRPRSEAVILAIVLAVIGWWVAETHMGLAGQPGQYWPMVLAPVQAALCSLVLRAGLDSAGAHAAAAQQADRHAALLTAQVDALRTEVSEHLDRVSSAARPFIAAVADGALDVRDDAVRARADRLERVLREDLSLGYAPGIRWAANQLRERGWFVTVRVEAEDIDDGGSAAPFTKAVPSPVDRAVRALTAEAISEGVAGDLPSGPRSPMASADRGYATISATTIAGQTSVTVLLLDNAGCARPYQQDLPAGQIP